MLNITLSEFADISQVVIAIASLALAAYIFIYQRRHDSASERATAVLNEQNIRLQWFKELVVQPSMNSINNFYANLHKVKVMIKSDYMQDHEKQDISEFIKKESSKLRKEFIDMLIQLNPKLGNTVMANIDSLIDGLTESIFNDDLKLTRDAVYDQHISSKISYSKNSLIALLFNYKGVQE
jgi:hypothetical protein